MEKKRSRRWIWVLAAVGVLVCAAVIWLGVRLELITKTQAQKPQYDAGSWIELAPEGIVSANGEPVHTEMRIGSENKVLVLFCGGGVSVNEFTASHPFTGARYVMDENGFYSADIDGMIPDYCGLGVTGGETVNPFRNWTVIVIPYTTADFHLGTADYAYTAQDGSRQVLHHHGYINYRAIMDEAIAYLDGAPEELLITGYSAGGFGAAALAGDLRESYFPDAGHVTLCVDSSLLIWDRFPETAHDVWGVPDELARLFRTDNPIVDFYAALYETYGDDMTYLYVGSVRDGELARYQNYFTAGRYVVTWREGRLFTEDLRRTLSQLGELIPGFGVYLFDSLPFSIYPSQISLTQHTILISEMVFRGLTDRVSPARWLEQAIEGDVLSHGYRLLR
mgnify:CR=1 FL=1